MLLVLAGTATCAVAVSGNYAYIGQGQDIVVLDVSSQDSPVELGRVMTSGVVLDVAVSGDYAYVADWGYVSFPSAPTGYQTHLSKIRPKTIPIEPRHIVPLKTLTR